MNKVYTRPGGYDEMQRDCNDFLAKYNAIPEEELGPQKDIVIADFMRRVRRLTFLTKKPSYTNYTFYWRQRHRSTSDLFFVFSLFVILLCILLPIFGCRPMVELMPMVDPIPMVDLITMVDLIPKVDRWTS